jgi:hypothetical protein
MDHSFSAGCEARQAVDAACMLDRIVAVRFGHNIGEFIQVVPDKRHEVEDRIR